MKRLLPILLCLGLVLSVTACGKQKPPQLEDFHESGGEEIVSTEDPHGTEPVTYEFIESDPGNGTFDGPEIVLDEKQYRPMSADVVKEWFQNEVSSEYVVTKSDNDLLIAHSAKLKDGGIITISEYAETYYNSVFSYTDSRDADVLYEKSVKFLHTYRGGGLLDSDAEALKSAIVSGLRGGSDVIYIESFTPFPLYVSVSDTTFSLICGW